MYFLSSRFGSIFSPISSFCAEFDPYNQIAQTEIESREVFWGHNELGRGDLVALQRIALNYCNLNLLRNIDNTIGENQESVATIFLVFVSF